LRENSLNDLTVAELLRLLVDIGEQLRTRGITRSENVPTGDLAEFLFCRAYGWEQAGNSEQAFDATDSEGRRYQIKGRRIHKRTSSRQLSAIRDLDGFDTLAAVLFDHHYGVLKAALIPNEVVRRRAKHVAHDNKWNFLLTDDVWREAGVRDVTVILKTAWKQLRSASEVTRPVDLSSLSEAQINKLQRIVDEAQRDQRKAHGEGRTRSWQHLEAHSRGRVSPPRSTVSKGNTGVKVTDKRSAMERVNATLGQRALHPGNTHFSNVNARKPVWWFNVDPRKFRNDLHLLCADGRGLVWLRIDANTVRQPERTFRYRSDKDMVDFEISCDPGRQYLRDVKSGGSGYDFRPHIRREWP